MQKMKKFVYCLILLLFAFAANALSIQEIEKLSANATLEKYPDAQTVLLYDDQQITFETDGTANDIDDMYQKALTDKGANNLRSVPLYFNEFYEKYHIEKLEIIRNNKITAIDIKANTKISVDDSQMEANIYDPHNKILFVNVPGMQKNDILHLKVRRETLRPRMKGFFTDITVLQSDDPILYYKLQYNAPEKMPLVSTLVKDELKGTLKKSVEKKNGRIIYTYTAQNVPQITPEPNAPPMYLFCQRILVSSASKWEDISKWYYDLCEPHLQKVTPEMKKFTSNLIKDCKTPAEKLRKIFDFVSQQIRYMGVTTETEAPGYEPHDVNITFEKRYGVCRDKAALLAAMLRLADIPAYMTLFYAGAPKDAEVPNNYFNHAVVAAQLPGSKDYILMDPTDENSTELLPAYGSNKSYLVARQNGDTLRLSPEIPPHKNRIDINNSWFVSSDGDLTGSSEISFYGINDNIYRDAFANWTKEYADEFFKSVINREFAGAKISKSVIYPSNIRDLRQILRVKVDFSVKNFVNSRDNISILPSHSLHNIFGALSMQLGKRTTLDKRSYPLQFFSTAAVNEKTTITFAGKNIKLEIPRYNKISNPFFNCTVSAGLNGNILTENLSMELCKTLISPAEYLQLVKSLKETSRELDKNILIHPVSLEKQAKNILVELNRREIDFTDARNWTDTFTVRYKVLDYAGVKSHAELAVPFDSACESVSLVSASVTAPDGKVHKIAASEVHIMDSGSTASAPAYAPQKILTVKFPHVVPQSIIEYKYEIKHKNMPFFADIFNFASANDTLLKEIILKNIPPSFNCSDIPGSVEVIEKGKNITLRKRNMRRIETEIAQAPLAMFTDAVFCSVINFQEYCSELVKLLNKSAANAPMTKELTLKLIKNCKTPAEKLTVIRDFADKQIRPAGPAFNDYNWTFAQPDDTLKRSYGNSADRAILLKAMTDAAGFKSEWLVRSSLGNPVRKTPYFGRIFRYFQNVYDNVALLVFDKGKILGILNANSRFAPVTQDNGSSKLSLNLSRRQLQPRTEALKRTVDRKKTDINLTVHPDLSITAEVLYTFSGQSAEQMRRFFAETDRRRQEQFFQQQTNAFSRLAAVKKPWRTADEKNSFKLFVTFSLKDYISRTGSCAVLPVPEIASLYAGIPGISGRKTPLWLNNEHLKELNIKIRLPHNYRPMGKIYVNINRSISNIFGCIYHRTLHDNTITINAVSVNDIGYLDPENAAAVSEYKKMLSSPDLSHIFLAKKSE